MNRNIWCLADIHGTDLPIENFLRRNKNVSKGDIIILLGDTGCNYFQDYRDKNLKKNLSKYPFTYFLIRGNHEMRPQVLAEKNPDQWEKIDSSLFGGPVWREKEYPNINYAMDYPCLYNFWTNQDDSYYFDDYTPYPENYSFLVIPGAYSVDKFYRIQKRWNWFENEQLTNEEMELGRKLIEQTPAVDIILSHTCPISYEPSDLFLSVVDQSTVDKTMERYLNEIEYKMKYKLYMFGHFHSLRIYPKHDNKQIIMLYNKEVFSVNKYFETFNPYICLY